MPANAIAIHRIAAAARLSARPSCTNPNAKTSTHETANKRDVYSTSRLRVSTIRSLRMTTATVLRNDMPDASIALAQGAWPVAQRFGAPGSQDEGVIDELFDRLEVVRGDDDNRAGASRSEQSLPQCARSGLIQARERLVEQHEPRRMQEGALERRAAAACRARRTTPARRALRSRRPRVSAAATTLRHPSTP